MKYILTAACLAALPASAGLSGTLDANFIESAPKDRFSFTNTGACDIGPATLSVLLEESVGGLIFDTTGDGAGVEVFQPYETVAGAESVLSVTSVTDGDTSITLNLNGLAAGKSVAFTIDVDDTLRHSSLGQIRVTDSEIAGATVVLETASVKGVGVFDNTSRAQVRLTDCTS